ncbi:MAG: hypothetical protein WAM60_25710, partial [Candidatus Promineifilaceae bacterium]
ARRTERLLVTIKNSLDTADSKLEPKLTTAQQYLNHLSYLLYLSARVTNKTLGIPEETILTEAESGEVKTYFGEDFDN